MCCNGSANWKREEVPDHKFDFIDVQEYRARGMLSRLKYGIFWAMVIKSFAVYIADIYTAITLLAFGHFSGTIYDKVQDDPENNFRVPITYGKWIFTGCILFSFLLLAYEAHKSRAIIRSRDISYAYTNVMANNYYSLRSYDHFCLFNQINNSKKKKDEFAFFIFFTFKGWKRLLVADGPRQVINFFTLYGLGSVAHWSTDPYDYYEGNWTTALMILTMLFTVAVFAASLVLLIIAAIMYIPLLCYIKGNLKEYCCHKIDKRISEMVKRKKKQRLLKQAAIARKEAAGDFSHLMNKKGEIVGRAIPQPTLPNVDVDLTDEKPGRPLHRTDSAASSTVARSQFNSAYNSPSMNPARFYNAEYSSTANLLNNAGPAGGETMAGAPGLPPGSGASPGFLPAHVHGMELLLDQMGPIGTSPMLLAQRMGGQGRASPQPGAHGLQAQSRPLVDPQSGLIHSPNLGARRVGSSPLNPEAPGQAIDSPYANGGLDYPPPKNVHGVEGLDFPPPAQADLSSFVPYSNGAEHGVNDAHGGNQLPSFDFDSASSDPAQRQQQQHRYGAHHGESGAAALGPPSPEQGGGGYDDVYDAYLNSQNTSQAATPERRNSAIAVGQAEHDWPDQGYVAGRQDHPSDSQYQAQGHPGWDYHQQHQHPPSDACADDQRPGQQYVQQYQQEQQQQHQKHYDGQQYEAQYYHQHEQQYDANYAGHEQQQQQQYGHAVSDNYAHATGHGSQQSRQH
ncbi:Potassium transporter [Thecaphora frezii]